MLLPRRDGTLACQARDTTRRVGRTFAIACRLLPRALRDDVYLLYLVFRTLDDLVDERDPEALARIEAVERWSRGGDAVSRETEILASLASRHSLPGGALRDFCRGRLAPFKVPKEITFAKRLPRNEQGKLQRRNL